jgi:dihydroxy-acid dehydratase
MVGHITPEAQGGGPIGLVQEGDTIAIDLTTKTLTLDISAQELKKRQAAWCAPKPRYTSGYLAKYAALVKSASEGAVTSQF